jgi:tRNA (mo5U34)-methyltransferase
MDQETLDKIKTIKWWHRIDLGDGVTTPGTTDSEEKLKRLHLPEDLTGKSVLDVGAWDGWWSFLCERRGASAVTAVDTWCFDTGRRGFDLATRVLNSKVVGIKLDVHDLDPDLIGKYDFVLCLGALHHFQNPLLALQKLHSVCKGKLILETHLDWIFKEEPICSFYDKNKPYGDPTCLWGPNPPCVESWLKFAGFNDAHMVSIKYKPANWSGDRGVFHALA